jgi:hypothetical protein
VLLSCACIFLLLCFNNDDRLTSAAAAAAAPAVAQFARVAVLVVPFLDVGM